MRCFDAEISPFCVDFFNDLFKKKINIDSINALLESKCGCVNFFSSIKEINQLQNQINEDSGRCVAEDRMEYGDFQTNIELSNSVVKDLLGRGVNPNFIIEPTCGKGNFIISALQTFPNIQQVLGVEIYEPYIWQCKFNILELFLLNPLLKVPRIQIINANVFKFSFDSLSIDKNQELLLLGNPPWVTNSSLGSMQSKNLPSKRNIKKQKGIDAITGKANFDIAESISLMLLEHFHQHKGFLAFLVKNSVVKNIVFEQQKKRFHVSNMEKLEIDSGKEFSVSVDASLFFCKLNSCPNYQCQGFNFYNKNKTSKMGWVDGHFFSNIEIINECQNVDGRCPFEWRQGVKHDCTQILELEKEGNAFINKLGERTQLEDALVFPLLKSSDLKQTIVHDSRKYTIVTQRRVGQSTDYIENYPLTWRYLTEHQDFFSRRKSSIYKGKAKFSIFGIGDYAFKPYKVAVSGLYKTYHFSLVLPNQDKPSMLDDTCYLLGFDKVEDAVTTLVLLNSDVVAQFLRAISFHDAKRMINKDVLMRIDIRKVLDAVPENELANQIADISKKIGITINPDLVGYQQMISEKQYSLF